MRMLPKKKNLTKIQNIRLLRAITQSQQAEIQPRSDWGTWAHHLKSLNHQSAKGIARPSLALWSLWVPGKTPRQLSHPPHPTKES